MIPTRILLTITALTLSLISYSQLTEEKVKQMAIELTEEALVREASTFTQEGYLYYAQILSNKLYTIDPESSNYNYRKGFLLLSVDKRWEEAVPYFQKAILDVDVDYDMYSAKEKSAPQDAYFHMGACYHLNEELDKAEENYKAFIAVSHRSSELLKVAELRLIQVEEARKQMAAPVSVYLKNMGPTINTIYPEYSPVVSLDGSALYFTSRKPWENNETNNFRDLGNNQFPEDVYVSYMDFDSTWTDPTRLDFCKPKRNEASVSMSPDERVIYLYEDTTGNGDLFFTEFYHAKFQEIEKVELKGVNTKYWETHCMMSPNQRRFFFVSDRKGGYGGRDIYVKERKRNGKWTSARNLGPDINTEYDEDSPFISIDNATLFYASNGDKSIGGFDIMRSQMDIDSSWSPGVNMGYPFNSCSNDIFYTTTIDGKRGYMTSFRNNGQGEKDIYEIYNDHLGLKDVAILKGIIKTVNDKPIPEDFSIDIRMVCVDCDDVSKKTVYPRLRDGVFMTSLEPCKTYRLEYRNLVDTMNIVDTTIMHRDSFTTFCDTAYQEIYRELLIDVDKGIVIFPEDTVIIPPVFVTEYVNLEFMHYFEYNKNKLSTKKGDLKDFVKQVEQQLKEGRESITINIYSSASHVPTKTYGTNIKLTSIRAENMKYDLIAHFEKKEDYKGKVNVVIVTRIVQGPEYIKDAGNKKKYLPYQYVGLKTE